MNYKITAVISVSGVKNDDDAIKALETMLCDWDEQKIMHWGLEDSKIDISVKTIKEDTI
jgi:hypothetical protein